VRSDAPLEDLLDQLEAARVKAGIPGLAVGVLRDGEILALRGFGFADSEERRPVTPDTPFNTASLAKPISAVVAMRLRELGRLSLDTPMAAFEDFDDFCQAALDRGGLFFDDWACDDPAITLRHVLSMTSNGELGTRFFYNPVAFSWASRPLAQAGGAPFSDLVAEHVFGPVGMTRSARIHRDLPLPDELSSDLAVPYHLAADSTHRRSDPPPQQGDGAAGGVISTVRDLAKFDLALDASGLIADSLRDEMWRPAGPGIPYGIGWFVSEVGGETTVWHTGLWEGAYSALYVKLPERHATLLLLANSDGLKWETDLDEAVITRSPFAQAFFSWLEN
jgi:CubicO group peptidase (beta-lactamase class C family)